MSDLLESLKAQEPRDWIAHWRGLLQDPRTDQMQRRIAYQALRNLGHPHREPGSDDE